MRILSAFLRNLSFCLVCMLMLAPAMLHADTVTNTGSDTDTVTNTGSDGPGLVNPLANNVDSLPAFLKAILGGVVEIGTIVLIMMLVYVGFLFVAARGNAEKLQGAKSALVWTVIGGLVLLGATSIQLVIEGTVNSLR